MEAVLALAVDWWWIAPATAAAGAAGYSALTTGRRRARRLELDAARHEEQAARVQLAAARAEVHSARARVLTARSQGEWTAPGLASLWEARRELLSARQAVKAAGLALRAHRNHVRAIAVRYRSASRNDALPIERLMAAHDTVTARWLAYETDAEKALLFPQMLDPRHPQTLAFLRAQHEAQRLRPASPRDRIAPAEYLAYRDAVRAVEVAFAAAEADARRAARAADGGSRPPRPRDAPWSPPRYAGERREPTDGAPR